MGRHTTVRLLTTAIFSAFAGYVYYIVIRSPHRLSTDPKICDLEWLFHVKFCFFFAAVRLVSETATTGVGYNPRQNF